MIECLTLGPCTIDGVPVMALVLFVVSLIMAPLCWWLAIKQLRDRD